MLTFLPALRRWLARYRFLYWTAVVAAALATFAVVSKAGAAAETERTKWGTSALIAVAQRDIPAGTALTAADVSLQRWPRALVPAGALEALPVGEVAAATIAGNEPVVAARLAPAGAGPVAARTPSDARAIGIPVNDEAVGVVPGDQVDLIATFPAGDVSDRPGTIVARRALVVGVESRLITVAVALADAPKVAAAVTAGSVVIAVVGPQLNNQLSTVAASTSTTTPATTR